MQAQRRPLDPNAMREDVSPDDPDLQGLPPPDDSALVPDEPVTNVVPLPKKRFPMFNRNGGMSSGGMGGYGGYSGSSMGGYGGYGGGKQVGQERTEIETERYRLITRLGLWAAVIVALLACVIVLPPVGVWVYLSLKNGQFQEVGSFASIFGHLAQVIATIFSSSS